MKEEKFATLGEDISSLVGDRAALTSRLRQMTTMFTSEKEIREQVNALFAQPVKKLSKDEKRKARTEDVKELVTRLAKREPLSASQRTDMRERWILDIIEKARKRGRLMTNQQLADWRIGRKLSLNDSARYIGPTREEKTQSGLIVERPSGQEGHIVSVEEGDNKSRKLWFRPKKSIQPIDAPNAEKQIVDLEVREFTAGWLMLERLCE